MTVAGLLLIGVGVAIAVASPVPYNGLWLLGAGLAAVGFALCVAHRKGRA